MWVKGQSPLVIMKEGAVYAGVHYRWMKNLVRRGTIQGWRLRGRQSPVLVSRAECILYRQRQRGKTTFSWGVDAKDDLSYGKYSKR